ncbi:MAG: phytanoyl-CoA dioxygenase family protein [Planctomycetota bacterium]|nr:phytanoyl-CoA dioxygenase family protein [Planctomycetota bacterium]
MSATATVTITEEQKRQYREEGFFILKNVIPPEHLQILREECQASIERINAEMDRKGENVQGINHRDNRYFITHPSNERPRLFEFSFSELMAEICRATIGDDAWFFWEQYVVKAAEKGMKFGWHQDSGYVGVDIPHKPYVTCWCALDDMSEENGTAYILPFSRAGTRTVVQHRREEGSNDLIGYFGSDPGDPVLVPAGSIAVFSSFTFHRSGFNRTPRWRRVYLAQYSGEIVLKPDGQPWGRFDPFMKDGAVIARKG